MTSVALKVAQGFECQMSETTNFLELSEQLKPDLKERWPSKLTENLSSTVSTISKVLCYLKLPNMFNASSKTLKINP